MNLQDYAEPDIIECLGILDCLQQGVGIPVVLSLCAALMEDGSQRQRLHLTGSYRYRA